MATVHVIYNGKTKDIDFDEMFPRDHLAEIGIPEGTVISTATLTPDQVKRAVAQYYDVMESEFQDHFIELNPNGNITIRPNTPFGK